MTEIVDAFAGKFYLGVMIVFVVAALATAIGWLLFPGTLTYRGEEHAANAERALGDSSIQDNSTSQTMQSPRTAPAVTHLP